MKNCGIVFLMSWLFVFQPLVTSDGAPTGLLDLTLPAVTTPSSDASSSTDSAKTESATSTASTTSTVSLLDAVSSQSDSTKTASSTTTDTTAASTTDTVAPSTDAAAKTETSTDASSTTATTDTSTTGSTTASANDAASTTTGSSSITSDSSSSTTATTDVAALTKSVSSSTSTSSPSSTAVTSTTPATTTTTTSSSTPSTTATTSSTESTVSASTSGSSTGSVATTSSTLTTKTPATATTSDTTTKTLAASKDSSSTKTPAAAPTDALKSATTTPNITIPVAPAASAVSTPPVASTAPTTFSSSDEVSGTLTSPKDEEDHITVTVNDTQQIDLDTMTIGVGGNWLQKRVYYEKAAELYEEIQDLVNQCEDTKTPFLNEVKNLEGKIDDFYKQVSSDKGNVTAMLSAYTDMLSMQEERAGDLSVNERAVQQTIIDEEAQIKEVGDSIEVMGNLDDKVDDIMQLVLTTIDSCRGYESKAWEHFKEITQSLDDQKARTLYYEMENFSDNIQQQLDYLNNTLFPFLQTTLGKQITDNIGVVESAVADLKTKGVNLGAEIKKYSEDDTDIEHERQQNEIDEASKQAVAEYKKQEAIDLAEKEAAEKERKKEIEEASWAYKFVTKIICPLKTAWAWLLSKATVLEPVGESVVIGALYLWVKCKQLLCITLGWLSKLKFW